MAARTPGQRLFSTPPPLYAVLEVLLLLGSIVLAVALLGDLKHGFFFTSSPAALAARRGDDTDIALPDEDACALDAAGISSADLQKNRAAAGRRPGSHRRRRHRHRDHHTSASASVSLRTPDPAPSLLSENL